MNETSRGRMDRRIGRRMDGRTERGIEGWREGSQVMFGEGVLPLETLNRLGQEATAGGNQWHCQGKGGK